MDTLHKTKNKMDCCACAVGCSNVPDPKNKSPSQFTIPIKVSIGSETQFAKSLRVANAINIILKITLITFPPVFSINVWC